MTLGLSTSGRRAKGRTFDSWKRLVIKRLKRRAMTFRDEAINSSERDAWALVVEWLESFSKNRSYLTKYGSIGIKGDDVDEL